MKMQNPNTLFLFLIFFITPILVNSQTKIIAGGGFTVSKFESYYDSNDFTYNRISPELGYKYLHPTVGFSFDYYLHSSVFLSANFNFGNNQIPYFDRGFVVYNALKFNQLATGLSINSKIFKPTQKVGILRGLILGVGINADHLYSYELGFEDRNEFFEIGIERNQINWGFLYQVAIEHKNFKLTYLNNLGFDKPENTLRYVKNLNWFSIMAGYSFVLKD